MRRILYASLVTAVGLSGCLPFEFTREQPPPPAPASAVVEKGPPVVTEGEVNATNAAERARALRAEIEFDMHRQAGGASPE